MGFQGGGLPFSLSEPHLPSVGLLSAEGTTEIVELKIAVEKPARKSFFVRLLA